MKSSNYIFRTIFLDASQKVFSCDCIIFIKSFYKINPPPFFCQWVYVISDPLWALYLHNPVRFKHKPSLGTNVMHYNKWSITEQRAVLSWDGNTGPAGKASPLTIVSTLGGCTENMHLPKYTVLSHFGHFDAMFGVNKETESVSVCLSVCLPSVCSSRHTSEDGGGDDGDGRDRRSHPPSAPSPSFA